MLNNYINYTKGKRVFLGYSVINIFNLALHHQDRPKNFIETAYQFVLQSSKAYEKNVHSLKDSKFSYSKRAFVVA